MHCQMGTLTSLYREEGGEGGSGRERRILKIIKEAKLDINGDYVGSGKSLSVGLPCGCEISFQPQTIKKDFWTFDRFLRHS